MTTSTLIEILSDIEQIIDCIASDQVVEIPTSTEDREILYPLLAQIMDTIEINEVRTSDGLVLLEESADDSVINYSIVNHPFQKSMAVAQTNELVKLAIINCYNYKSNVD